MIRQEQQELDRLIEQALDDARAALPNGSDRELEDWIMTHRRPSPELRQRLGEEALKDSIIDRAANGHRACPLRNGKARGMVDIQPSRRAAS
jgi:hypothetical protein